MHAHRPADSKRNSSRRGGQSGRGLAAVFLVALSLRIPGFGLVPVAAALAPLLLPHTAALVREVPRARSLVIGSLAAVAFGSVLRLVAPEGEDGAPLLLSMTVFAWFLGMLLLGLCAAAALRLLGIVHGLVAYAIGSLAGNALELGFYGDLAAKWKYALALPIILLMLVVLRRSPVIVLMTVSVLLVGLSLWAHARSVSLVLIVAVVAAVVAGQRRGGFAGAGSRRLALAVVAPVVALALSYAMTEGLFGTELQSVQQRQSASGESILVGGRTEYAATLDLAADRPLGYGVAARPSSGAIASAVTAAGAVGGNIYGPYYLTSVFAPRVDLHSSLSNAWFHFGLVGLFVMLLIPAAIFSAALKGPLSRTDGAAAAYFVLCTGLFDIYGSPMMQGNRVAIALGVALAMLGARR
jgi:hypothetical protein